MSLAHLTSYTNRKLAMLNFLNEKIVLKSYRLNTTQYILYLRRHHGETVFGIYGY